MMLTDLADVLRAAGLKVQEIAGWTTRGHGQMTDVEAIICHHTAGPKTGNYPSLGVVRDGREDLAGPLAQLGLARDGTWLVIAAGLCWHAGVVFESWQGNPHAIGIEAEGTGTDPWPTVQYDSYVAGVRALRAHYDVPLSRVLGHKEVAKPLGRKNDPNFDMDDFRAEVAKSNDQEDELMGAREDILAYQKACTIQIQNNTRQLLNNAVAGILDGVQKYAVAVNNFTRQTDAGSDAERAAELDKLKDELAATLAEALKAVPAGMAEPGETA
jgi:Negative regulator of beta-lactamase expression